MIKLKWTDIVNKDIPMNRECDGDESVLLPLQDLQAVFQEKLENMDEADNWLENRRKRKLSLSLTLEKDASANQGGGERPMKRSRFVHNLYHLAEVRQ